MKSLFCCPVCKSPLSRGDKVYLCPNGHTFDVSKKGYVNLFLNNSQSSHGDNKEMLAARRSFLSAGHYDFLAEAVTSILFKHLKNGDTLVDIGCGEGYYTNFFYEHLNHNHVTVLGTDISKAALAFASGKNRTMEYAVATNAKLPLLDHSMRFVTALFTPFPTEEIHRVLKEGGYFLHVMPDTCHLMGLKRVLYDTPYENEIPAPFETEFTALSRMTLTRTVTLPKLDAANLFLMTPYYYKTSKAAQDKFFALDSLTTEFSFVITLYSPISTRR